MESVPSRHIWSSREMIIAYQCVCVRIKYSLVPTSGLSRWCAVLQGSTSGRVDQTVRRRADTRFHNHRCAWNVNRDIARLRIQKRVQLQPREDRRSLLTGSGCRRRQRALVRTSPNSSRASCCPWQWSRSGSCGIRENKPQTFRRRRRRTWRRLLSMAMPLPPSGCPFRFQTGRQLVLSSRSPRALGREDDSWRCQEWAARCSRRIPRAR